MKYRRGRKLFCVIRGLRIKVERKHINQRGQCRKWEQLQVVIGDVAFLETAHRLGSVAVLVQRLSLQVSYTKIAEGITLK